MPSCVIRYLPCHPVSSVTCRVFLTGQYLPDGPRAEHQQAAQHRLRLHGLRHLLGGPASVRGRESPPLLTAGFDSHRGVQGLTICQTQGLITEEINE